MMDMNAANPMEPQPLEPQPVQPGKTPRRRMLWIVLGALSIYMVAAWPSGPPKGWLSDFDEATTKAASTNQPMLVAFHSQGCPPCLAMDRLVLRSREVQKAVESFVPVRLDAYDHPDLADRFEVTVTPTYAVLDAKGRILAKWVGYREAEEFIELLVLAVSSQADGNSSVSAALSPPVVPVNRDSTSTCRVCGNMSTG